MSTQDGGDAVDILRAASTGLDAASGAPRPRAPTPSSSSCRLQMQAKQRSIEELEDLRRRRLSDLQANLAEARTTYTESHPTIADLKQSIAALSVESAQVTGLRKEAAALKAEYDSRVASASEPQLPAIVWTSAAPSSRRRAPPRPLRRCPGDVLRLALDLREDRDPGMVYARGQLRDAMDKYAALRTQIQTAQIDLETAQAAFKYRYTVVTPAHLPKSPTVPNVPLVTLAALRRRDRSAACSSRFWPTSARGGCSSGGRSKACSTGRSSRKSRCPRMWKRT